MTRRCLVIAWRVTLKPPVSPVMDIGPPSQRRATSCKRVSSPNAAKRRAEPVGVATAFALRCLGKVPLDQLHDHAPTSLVCRERLRPARERDSIEARLGNGQ